MASLAEFSDAVKKEGKELQSLLHFKQMVRNFEESKSEFTQEEFDKYTDVVLDLSKALRTDTNPLTNAIERRHYINDINESLGYDISKNLTEVLDTEELFRLSFLLNNGDRLENYRLLKCVPGELNFQASIDWTTTFMKNDMILTEDKSVAKLFAERCGGQMVVRSIEEIGTEDRRAVPKNLEFVEFIIDEFDVREHTDLLIKYNLDRSECKDEDVVDRLSSILDRVPNCSIPELEAFAEEEKAEESAGIWRVIERMKELETEKVSDIDDTKQVDVDMELDL